MAIYTEATSYTVSRVAPATTPVLPTDLPIQAVPLKDLPSWKAHGTQTHHGTWNWPFLASDSMTIRSLVATTEVPLVLTGHETPADIVCPPHF